jgi:predicted TIM-barrel fold metal-dependent hydrolase
MIVDTHVYCYRSPDEPAGYPTVADHMRVWQWSHAGHHQPAFSTRDRRPGDASLLMARTPDEPWGIADRDFRVDRTHGRVIWTVEGEDFTKHIFPPNALEFSAGACIGEMDYAGIDWALMHVDEALDKDNEFMASCVRAYPHRLRSMAVVDERLIPTDPDRAIGESVHAIEDLGLHALKIIPEYAYRMTDSTTFDDASWRPYWDAVTQLGVPIFFTLGSARGAVDARQGFLDELWTLRRWSDRYPDTKVSVTHGFPWRAYVEDDRLATSPSMWEPFQDSAIHLEVSFPIRIGDLFDYPYRPCWPALQEMVAHIGPERLMYGTDMPFQNRFCTYRQSRDWIQKHMPALIGDDAVEAIMGGTAARFLELPARGGAG